MIFALNFERDGLSLPGGKMVVIIDYGMGNLGSIRNMLDRLGVGALISSRAEDIVSAEKLILPGVGAFDQGMRNLQERGLIPILEEKVVKKGCVLLGICLGMQLLTKSSEEGTLPGLGWVRATTRRFAFGINSSNLKIPHMGWNEVRATGSNGLFGGFEETPRFYFVHSYHVCCDDENDVVGKTFYGYEFVSAMQSENVIGVQFHPEKSHKFGLRLLKNINSL